jgi:hypothetical protein
MPSFGGMDDAQADAKVHTSTPSLNNVPSDTFSSFLYLGNYPARTGRTSWRRF